jgi:O-antigen ligase
VLGLAADVGLVGLASFVALVWVVIARLVRARRDPSTRGVTSAALVSVCLYLGCSAFLHLAYARYLWLYLALATAASGLGSSRATEEPRPTLLPATLSGPSGPPSGAPQAGLVSR